MGNCDAFLPAACARKAAMSGRGRPVGNFVMGFSPARPHGFEMDEVELKNTVIQVPTRQHRESTRSWEVRPIRPLRVVRGRPPGSEPAPGENFWRWQRAALSVSRHVLIGTKSRANQATIGFLQ